MSRSPKLRWRRVLLSLMLTGLLACLITLALAPSLARGRRLSDLASSDPDTRQRGLRYVVHYAATDPKVLQGAIRRLRGADDTAFLQIAAALDLAAKWSRPPLSDDSWLRWLKLLAGDQAPQTRTLAMQHLGELPHLARDARVLGLLEQGLADDDPDVRYNALVAAAALAGGLPRRERAVLEALVAQATSDADPTVARHAWLFLGLLDPASGQHGDWRKAPPAVAQAMMWACLRTNPDNPAPALEALADPEVPPSVRAMAAYLLYSIKPKAAQTAFVRLAVQAMAADPESDAVSFLLLWRAALAVPLDGPDPGTFDAATIRLLATWSTVPLPAPPPTTQPADDAEPGPGAAALASRPADSAPGARAPTTRPATVPATEPAVDPVAEMERGLTLAAKHKAAAGWGSIDNLELDQRHPLETLAILDGLPKGKFTIAVTPRMPDYVRLLAVAATHAPQPRDLLPLFASESSTVRDLACVVAADRLTTKQNDELVGQLLRPPLLWDDNNKRSAAILAGLTGVQAQRLARKTADEDMPLVKQVMQLGMWMQGQKVAGNMDALAPGLLLRDDVPRTTVLLALLHKRPTAALDYLLTPREQEQRFLDLRELLCQRLWWKVLERYLPQGPDGAPPFWTWADGDLQQFQIDLLRDWYLVHRRALMAMPTPATTPAR